MKDRLSEADRRYIDLSEFSAMRWQSVLPEIASIDRAWMPCYLWLIRNPGSIRHLLPTDGAPEHPGLFVLGFKISETAAGPKITNHLACNAGKRFQIKCPSHVASSSSSAAIIDIDFDPAANEQFLCLRPVLRTTIHRCRSFLLIGTADNQLHSQLPFIKKI